MCAEKPGDASCADYMYPKDRSVADIEANCQAMPFMVACSVWKACKDENMSGDICEPFNILASSCQDLGMQNMAGCAVYTPMCLISIESVVPQCRNAGIERLVDTMPTQVCSAFWHPCASVLYIYGACAAVSLAYAQVCKLWVLKMQQSRTVH